MYNHTQEYNGITITFMELNPGACDGCKRVKGKFWEDKITYQKYLDKAKEIIDLDGRDIIKVLCSAGFCDPNNLITRPSISFKCGDDDIWNRIYIDE